MCSIVLLLNVVAAFSQQGKKPTITILPSDNWCAQRFFTTRFNNQGNIIELPN